MIGVELENEIRLTRTCQSINSLSAFIRQRTRRRYSACDCILGHPSANQNRRNVFPPRTIDFQFVLLWWNIFTSKSVPCVARGFSRTMVRHMNSAVMLLQYLRSPRFRSSTTCQHLSAINYAVALVDKTAMPR